MKILVSLREMVLGGVQVNAIDLAKALRDKQGFDPVIMGIPGPMVQYAEQNGLRFIPAPPAPYFTSFAGMAALRDAVRREQPDLIHVWDSSKCLEAYYAVHLPMRIPLVVTDMLHHVTRVLPKSVPTTFGVPILVDEAKALGRSPLHFMPPPVDCEHDAPGAVDPSEFRERCGIQPGEIVVVTVSRLDATMKGESLWSTLEIIRELGRTFPVKLIVTGDGDEREALEKRAAEINAELGRTAILFTGALLDPRCTYAVADIAIGMGGSCARGMAFGKATIVVGINGFAKLLRPETAESIRYNGNYGSGPGGRQDLTDALRWLLEHPAEIAPLGKFAREFVVENFSLEGVTARFAEFCDQAVEIPAFGRTAWDAVRTAGVYFRERVFLRTYSPPPAFSLKS